MRLLFSFLFSVCLFIQSAQALSDSWFNTYESGLEQAQKDKKDIIFYFNGSDWCEQCKKFEAAVLSKESFFVNAGKNFVLVQIDIPLGNREVAERNAPIQEKFGVRGYPALIITDSAGLPYGDLRSRPDWVVTDYLKALDDLNINKLTRDEARLEFENANDDAGRTTALEKLLRSVPRASILRLYSKEFDALRKSSKDASPLVAETAKKDRIEKFQTELNTLMGQRRFEDAETCCEGYLAQDVLEIGEIQMGLTSKYFALMQLGKFEEAVEVSKSLLEVDPKSPIVRQAMSMQRKALAAATAARESSVPAEKVKPTEKVPTVSEQKEKGSAVAKTEQLSPASSQDSDTPNMDEEYQKVLAAMEASHEVVADAEKAFAEAEAALAKAKANLEAAQKTHLRAHEVEAKMSQMGEKKKP